MERTAPKKYIPKHLQTQRQKRHTVDGQNPAPPRMMIIPLFIGFLTIPGGAGFRPSAVGILFFFQVFSVNR